jgi:hypothetical protein
MPGAARWPAQVLLPRRRVMIAGVFAQQAVPPNERVGPHNREQRPPLHPSGEDHQHHPGGAVRAAWSDLTFEIARELLPQEQILGRESRPRPERQSNSRKRSRTSANAVGITWGDDTVSGQSRDGLDSDTAESVLVLPVGSTSCGVQDVWRDLAAGDHH